MKCFLSFIKIRGSRIGLMLIRLCVPSKKVSIVFMEQEKMIDLVVPVYNVEKYLPKCLDSVLAQKCKTFHVILVNDGSTDNSGKICDRYAAEWPDMIDVYHKANGGLSDARNFGVSRSKAQYITFIDSDDYIGDEYIKTFYDLIIKTKADLIITPLCRQFGETEDKRLVYPNIDLQSGNISREEAIIQLCVERNYASHAVCKLFRKDLLINNPYPIGKYFEDSYTTYKHVMAARTIIFLPTVQYYYLQREGSIQRHKFEEKHFDLMFAGEEMMNFFEAEHMSAAVMEAGGYHILKAANITLQHARNEKDFWSVYDRCRKIFMKYYHSGMQCKYANQKEKAIFIAMNRFPHLYRMIFLIIRR